jgi:thiol-disulfide isomerase/thioredoxin
MVLVTALALARTAAAVEANQLLPWRGGATPALKLPDLQGASVDLAAFRGKTVIVNFWATWCGPCREEMPSLAALAKRRGGGDIVVLAVDVGETRASVQRFLARNPVDLPILLDTDGYAALAWKVEIYPSSFVIAPDGRIRQFIAGALEWDDPAIVRQLPGAAAPTRQ